MASIVSVTGKNVPQLQEYTAIQNDDLIYIVKANGTTKEDQNRKLKASTLKSWIETSPGTVSNSPHQECFTISAVPEDTVTLSATPINSWVIVFINQDLQTGNYSITDNDLTFDAEVTLNVNDVVCVWYFESLGASGAVQNLQSVSDVGNTTTRQLLFPSLRFNVSNGEIRNSANNILLQTGTNGVHLLNTDVETVLAVTADGVSMPEDLAVAGTLTFTGYTAGPGETNMLTINENGVVGSSTFPDFHDVTSVDNETTNPIITGNHTVNGTIQLNSLSTGAILSNNGFILMKLESSNGWSLHHNGIKSLQSETDGLRLLSSRYLKFEGSTSAKVRTLDYIAGNDFTDIDDQGRGVIYRNDGDIEFWTKPESTGSLTKYFEIGKSGEVILNAVTGGTPANMLVVDSNNVVRKAALPSGALSGTANRVAKFNSGGDGIDDSIIAQSSTSSVNLFNSSNNSKVVFNVLAGNNQIISQQNSDTTGKELQIITKNSAGVSVSIASNGQVTFNDRPTVTPNKFAVFNSSGVLGEADYFTKPAGTNLTIPKFNSAETDGLDNSLITQTSTTRINIDGILRVDETGAALQLRPTGAADTWAGWYDEGGTEQFRVEWETSGDVVRMAHQTDGTINIRSGSTSNDGIYVNHHGASALDFIGINNPTPAAPLHITGTNAGTGVSVIIATLPTSDPGVPGALYHVAGALMVST